MIKKHVLLLNWLVRAENYLSWQSFTACLRNDFGESIYVLGVCVTLTATIFHRHLKIAAVLNGFALWLAGNFHRRIFISHRLKMTVEFSIDILSYNRAYSCEFAVFGIETFIFGNLTKPLSILHFLMLP